MIIVIFLYDFIFLIFALLYLPYFLLRKKFHKDIWQRFGLFRAGAINHPIWLHAVSVGEVAAIRPLWERLRQEFPSQRIAVSTVTKAGNGLAKRFAKKEEIVFYLPLDLSFIIGSVLRRVNPKALIIAETEIWPNLVTGCHKKAIPIILVNGRISDKAYPRYRLAKIFLRHILEKIDFICARSEEDKKRFVALGAPSQHIKVTGNMKYDIKDYIDHGLCGVSADLRLKMDLGNDEKIFVAGSTHKGEEELILTVFKNLMGDFRDLRLIIAPRHVERAPEIKRAVDGFSVKVIDKIGVLGQIYGISDIVFVGGSLVRGGGHNIIEPAIFAKPIIFGPYMFNFQEEAREFLKADAAIMVNDASELEAACRRLLSDEGERQRFGENARRVVSNNQGAVENCLCELRGIL